MLKGFLEELIRQGGSDLLLVHGVAPSIRLNGEVHKIGDQLLDGGEIETLVRPVLTPIAAEQYSAVQIADSSYRIAGLGRFRINLHRERGHAAATIRALAEKTQQIGDIIERVLQDIEDKKIRPGRRFSEAGMAEICHLHERLISNLRLGMSVFLDGHVRDASRLLEEKARFRDLEHEYAASHIARLRDNTAQSIETSSLHLDLISDLKRINSHICSIAYPILESAGVLSQTRIRHSRLAEIAPDDATR